MSNAAVHRSGLPAADFPAQAGLRARIGWICHGLRIAAVVWISWAAVTTALAWSDKAMILDVYQRWLAIDVTGISNVRYAMAAGVVALSVLAVVPVVVCLWRLAGSYLGGRVFTTDAADWLHRTAIAAVTAIVIAILTRPLIASIIASQPVLLPPRGIFIRPEDLLHLIFAAFVLALARIFKAAAEMADDHAQIV
jgi:hypothetical protein